MVLRHAEVLLGHVPVGNVEDVREDVPVPRAHRGLQDTSHMRNSVYFERFLKGKKLGLQKQKVNS
jgi:hypothetical protein